MSTLAFLSDRFEKLPLSLGDLFTKKEKQSLIDLHERQQREMRSQEFRNTCLSEYERSAQMRRLQHNHARALRYHAQKLIMERMHRTAIDVATGERTAPTYV